MLLFTEKHVAAVKKATDKSHQGDIVETLGIPLDPKTKEKEAATKTTVAVQ